MGQKYATITAAGLATGFYDADVNTTIPQGAIAISDAVWQSWTPNTSGQALVNGALVPYTPPAPPPPTLPQQAAAALAAGVQIVSTGTPALSGTYACDPTSQQKMMAVSLYIQVNARFPRGVTSFPWPDVSGATHAFASTTEFQVFATAIADYVSGLDMVVAGVSTSLPAQPVTIA